MSDAVGPTRDATVPGTVASALSKAAWSSVPGLKTVRSGSARGRGALGTGADYLIAMIT